MQTVSPYYLKYVRNKRAANVSPYSFRDAFTSPNSAPLPSPRIADPGPGSGITLVDTESKLSIKGGKLQFTFATAQAWGDPCYLFTGLSRTAGRTLFGTITLQSITVACLIGWNANGTSNNGQAYGAVLFNAGSLNVRISLGSAPQVGTYATYITYKCAIVLRAAGSFIFIKGGAFTNWTLLWVDRVDNQATVYPCFSNKNNSGAVKELFVRDIGGAFATLSGFATSYSATSTDGQSITATADGVFEHTITAATGVDQEIRVRWTDDNNCIIVRMAQAGSTIQVFSKVAGVETSLGSAQSQTWTNGTSYTVVVVCSGTSIKTFVATVLKNSVTSAVNQAVTGLKVSKAGTVLAAWPLTTTYLDAFETSSAYRILTIGDSKTDGTGDSTPPVLGANGYPPILVDSLGASSWTEQQRLAVGGTTVATWQARIDADLALITTAPTHVLINLGVNDIASGQSALTPATWQSNLAYILDAIHTKFSSAKIYVAKVWRQTDNGQMTALNDTWIPAVLATRSTWAFAGIDERNILPGSDNGATNTSDGVHPNRTGYTLEAAAWKVAIGQ
jgi:lysophospholipase L1-like esterase